MSAATRVAHGSLFDRIGAIQERAAEGLEVSGRPIIDFSGLPAICPDCERQDGLCGRDHCRRGVLPQLAKPALVRLIGEVLVEQKKRQKPTDPKEKMAIARIGRRNARRQARSKRRGYVGLAIAIMEKKRP